MSLTARMLTQNFLYVSRLLLFKINHDLRLLKPDVVARRLPGRLLVYLIIRYSPNMMLVSLLRS
jgi:hypothetical protein